MTVGGWKFPTWIPLQVQTQVGSRGGRLASVRLVVERRGQSLDGRLRGQPLGARLQRDRELRPAGQLVEGLRCRSGASGYSSNRPHVPHISPRLNCEGSQQLRLLQWGNSTGEGGHRTSCISSRPGTAMRWPSCTGDASRDSDGLAGPGSALAQQCWLMLIPMSPPDGPGPGLPQQLLNCCMALAAAAGPPRLEMESRASPSASLG